jgi:tetratricopeptide (TPR) repeat protein
MSYLKIVFIIMAIILQSACAGKKHTVQSGAMEIEQRAEEFYNKANLQLAEVEYRKLLAMVPQYAKGWFKLGNIYLRSNQLDAAISHYEKALSFDAKMTKAWHNLSLARIRQATNTLLEGQRNVEKSESFEIDSLLNKLLILQKVD